VITRTTPVVDQAAEELNVDDKTVMLTAEQVALLQRLGHPVPRHRVFCFDTRPLGPVGTLKQTT
jgi:hypothetical protein